MNKVGTFVNILMSAIRTGISEAVLRELRFLREEIVGRAFRWDFGKGAFGPTLIAFQDPSRLGHGPIVELFQKSENTQQTLLGQGYYWILRIIGYRYSQA
jgi:hypothetical protein